MQTDDFAEVERLLGFIDQLVASKPTSTAATKTC